MYDKTLVAAEVGMEFRALMVVTDALWQAPSIEAARATRVTGRRRRALVFMGPIIPEGGPGSHRYIYLRHGQLYPVRFTWPLPGLACR